MQRSHGVYPRLAVVLLNRMGACSQRIPVGQIILMKMPPPSRRRREPNPQIQPKRRRKRPSERPALEADPLAKPNRRRHCRRRSSCFRCPKWGHVRTTSANAARNRPSLGRIRKMYDVGQFLPRPRVGQISPGVGQSGPKRAGSRPALAQSRPNLTRRPALKLDLRFARGRPEFATILSNLAGYRPNLAKIWPNFD